MHERVADKITEIIEADTQQYGTVWSVAALNTSKVVFGIEPDRPFEAASLNKLAIAFAAGSQRPDLQGALALQSSDFRGGNGILKHFPKGFEVPVKKAYELSLSLSDNTATRLVVRNAGGPSKVNSDLASFGWLRHTRLAQPADTEWRLYRGDPAVPYLYGQTTATETARLHQEVLRHQVFAKALQSGDFAGGIRQHIEERPLADFTFPKPGLLAKAAILKRLPLLRLPHAFYTELLNAPLPKTRYPNKEGTVDNLHHDVAQLGRITLAVLSESPIPMTGPEHEHHTRKVQATVGALILRSQAHV